MYNRSSLPSSAMYAPPPQAPLPQNVAAGYGVESRRSMQTGSESLSETQMRSYQAGGTSIPANYVMLRSFEDAELTVRKQQTTDLGLQMSNVNGQAGVKEALQSHGGERKQEEAKATVEAPRHVPEARPEPVKSTESPAVIPADVMAESPYGAETSQIYACDHGCGFCGSFSEGEVRGGFWRVDRQGKSTVREREGEEDTKRRRQVIPASDVSSADQADLDERDA
eukprot:450725-Hanusia_phi.AAC.4